MRARPTGTYGTAAHPPVAHLAEAVEPGSAQPKPSETLAALHLAVASSQTRPVQVPMSSPQSMSLARAVPIPTPQGVSTLVYTRLGVLKADAPPVAP